MQYRVSYFPLLNNDKDVNPQVKLYDYLSRRVLPERFWYGVLLKGDVTMSDVARHIYQSSNIYSIMLLHSTQLIDDGSSHP